MKIRILNNTIRLRLDRSEVDEISVGRAVSGSTHFPGGQVFGYQLTAAEDTSEAEFDGSAITLSIARADLLGWAGDEQLVGIYQSLPTKQGTLKLVIEKDFECLEPRGGESQSNRFANPKTLS